LDGWGTAGFELPAGVLVIARGIARPRDRVRERVGAIAQEILTLSERTQQIGAIT
jgi:hypothetical protein